MILKLDGTQNRFFALANENKVPDLDVVKYLNQIRYATLNIRSYELENGDELEIPMIDDNGYSYIGITNGLKAYIQGCDAADGIYTLMDRKNIIYVENGKVKSVITPVIYTTKYGVKVEVHQKNSTTVTAGDKVYFNGSTAPDGKYRLGFLNTIRVRSGEVVK
jgi:hypothetical protein